MAASSNTTSMRNKSAQESPTCFGAWMSSSSPSPTFRPNRARSKTFLSIWSSRDEPPRGRRDLQIRNGALQAHAVAEPRHAGDHHLALLRGVRRRDRLAHERDRRRALRRVHRAGADHAVDLHREPAEVHRHHLRGAVGAGVALRAGAGLRRRGGDQVDRPRPGDPRHRQPVRAGEHRAPGVDDRVPRAHRDHLLPVRLRPRHLGQRLRAAAVHPDAGDHAAHLPRRRVLLHRHAAAGVARLQPVQSDRLPDQRLSLELLRHRGRAGAGEPGDDAGVFRALPRGGGLDLQNRLPPQDLMIRTATQADAAAATSVLLLAFAADPMTRWSWPAAEAYLAHFPAAVRAFGGEAFGHGGAHLAEGGAALWLPPGSGPDEEALGSLLQRTAPASIWGDLAAILKGMGRYHPREPHWYLPLIGVDPVRQGRGLGSALMRHALALCDRDRLPAYLESSNPANIPLYERHGFERLGAIQSGDSPTVVPMLRRARS